MSAGNLTQESDLYQCAKPPKVLTVGAEGQQPESKTSLSALNLDGQYALDATSDASVL